MGLDLKDAAVVLSGASSGIGAATAEALAGRGARLGLLARRVDRLDATAEACRRNGSRQVEVIGCDLADVWMAESVAGELDTRLGGVDVLINNAGMPMRRPVHALRPADVERTMAVNFFSPARMMLTLLPAMLQRRRGSIVNVSSIGGRIPIQAEAAYCASKAALCGWTEAMLADLAGTGVDVRLILPGPIDSEIWDQPGNDPARYDGPLESPSLVANGIVAAIEGDIVEHYIPDLKAVAEMKTADLAGFVAAMANYTDGDGNGVGVVDTGGDEGR